MKCVIVPLEQYEHLLKRSVCAPKNLPVLTGKQKAKVNDALDTAYHVNVVREKVAQMPLSMQKMAADTLH